MLDDPDLLRLDADISSLQKSNTELESLVSVQRSELSSGELELIRDVQEKEDLECRVEGLKAKLKRVQDQLIRALGPVLCKHIDLDPSLAKHIDLDLDIGKPLTLTPDNLFSVMSKLQHLRETTELCDHVMSDVRSAVALISVL